METGMEKIVLSERAKEILDNYKDKPEDVIKYTKKFMYDMLGPAPDRGDMLYRYEHSIRVAENAKIIASKEDIPEEPLVIACLLHDVGYNESDNHGGFSVHQHCSAEIAKVYLANIGYDESYRDEMIKAIDRHNLTDNLPEDMTVFQMTVRDCDDIDRFDMIRISMVLGDCTNEKTNSEIIDSCVKEIDKAKWRISLKRGTKTADEIFVSLCEKRIALLQDVIAQAKKGF